MTDPTTDRLREAIGEVRQWGDVLVTLIAATPAECRREDDMCVPHWSEWTTRDGVDSGHCEWIEARQEAIPAWFAAQHDLGTALAEDWPAEMKADRDALRAALAQAAPAPDLIAAQPESSLTPPESPSKNLGR